MHPYFRADGTITAVARQAPCQNAPRHCILATSTFASERPISRLLFTLVELIYPAPCP